MLNVGITPNTDGTINEMLTDGQLLYRYGKLSELLLEERKNAHLLYPPETIDLARQLCDACFDHPEFYCRYLPLAKDMRAEQIDLAALTAVADNKRLREALKQILYGTDDPAVIAGEALEI
jgi:hypothetical protein